MCKDAPPITPPSSQVRWEFGFVASGISAKDGMMDSHEFCQGLVHRFKALGLLMQEHIAAYDELLPHVFMGEITRYILSGGSQRLELVNHLNNAMRKEKDEIQNLIAVSFIENLSNEEELNRALQDVDADAIREEWHRQHP